MSGLRLEYVGAVACGLRAVVLGSFKLQTAGRVVRRCSSSVSGNMSWCGGSESVVALMVLFSCRVGDGNAIEVGCWCGELYRGRNLVVFVTYAGYPVRVCSSRSSLWPFLFPGGGRPTSFVCAGSHAGVSLYRSYFFGILLARN
jgi:hypothetical protein